MKSTVLVGLFLVYALQFFSQKSDIQVLFDLDSLELNSINQRGLRLFKKSDCYNKRERYFSIPEFYVFNKIPLDNLEFIDSNNILKNLYFENKFSKKLSTEIGWNIFLTRNSFVMASSDVKNFYCNYNSNLFTDIQCSDILELDEIRYIFNIYDTDLSVRFIVDKEKNIFVHLNRDRSLLTLSEFKKLYDSGKLEHLFNSSFKK